MMQVKMLVLRLPESGKFRFLLFGQAVIHTILRGFMRGLDAGSGFAHPPQIDNLTHWLCPAAAYFCEMRR